MQIPGGRPAAAVADQSLAVDPEAAAGRILDPVIIAQARFRRRPPPFGSDPLGPLDAGDVVHRPPPDEPPRHAFGGRINHRDRLRPVEQALWSYLPLSFAGEVRGGPVFQCRTLATRPP